MKIETPRLLIRDVKTEDEIPFVKMAADGSLNDCGFDSDCSSWSIGCSYYEDFQETGITYFIGAQYRNNGYATEAIKAYTEYFFKHYHAKKMIAAVREENVPSWKAIEKAGFTLIEKRMYKDLNDEKAELYRFYKVTS